MITIGIDMGIENVKAVVLKDGKVVGMALVASGGAERSQSAEQAWQEALKQAKLTQSDVDKVVSTGQWRWDAGFADEDVAETVAEAKAAHWLFPQARSVIDIGADKARAIKFDADGKIIQFYRNQKCSLGFGLLIESMARTLGMTIEEISHPGTGKQNGISLNDRCGPFAELDAVLLLHDNVPRESIAQALSEAIATRLNSLVNEMGLDKEVAVIGGVAQNAAVVNALSKLMGVKFLIPEQPQFAGALGAALIAAS
ncbi:MAG: CoA activase [Chloroflexi bacterium]|nr:CoA activase [Chloroflexota bacterium]